MLFMAIDSKTTEFVLDANNVELKEFEKRFPGTVRGAIEMTNYIREILGEYARMGVVMSSSDYNHPDEFPEFEPYSIDIAAGYYEEAIEAGVIKVEK